MYESMFWSTDVLPPTE